VYYLSFPAVAIIGLSSGGGILIVTMITWGGGGNVRNLSRHHRCCLSRRIRNEVVELFVRGWRE